MNEIISLSLGCPDSPENRSGSLGRAGEEMAARFLRKTGYRLVAANFVAPVGRNSRGAVVTGEIDLVALDGDVLCFVEVKTRRSDDFASPLAAIDLRKQRQITRTARVYRKIFDLAGVAYRFDAVTIVTGKEKRPRIELHRALWTEDKFRKHSWSAVE